MAQCAYRFHSANCPEYKNIINSIWNTSNKLGFRRFSISTCPIFKVRLDVSSKEDVKTILTSSGTSGQDVSKIYLDSKPRDYNKKL